MKEQSEVDRPLAGCKRRRVTTILFGLWKLL